MGEIKQLVRRHFQGLVADKAAVIPFEGDHFYATDTEALFIGYGGVWVHQPRWVERLTNAADFAIGAFTTNGVLQVNGLDLTGIIPVGTVKTKLKLVVDDDAADSWLTIFRDAVNVENHIQARVPAANVGQSIVEDVSIDTDRLLDYQAKNVVFVTINLTILGWWV